jgi:lipopolysaccharide/colanic/teichoic acid biosynthesis glycosyltransferase
VQRPLKRLLDLILAGTALAALSPLLAAIAWLVKREDGGPILYSGRRVGQRGRPFRMHKFRTMVVNADRLGGSSTADDDPRMTRVGLRLRKHKLDELPQLINVVRGEMSLVGPRPEVQQFVDLLSAEERAILDVPPGITDWASLWNCDEGALLAGADDPDRVYLEQIRPTKLQLQLEYVRTRSIRTDLRILALTALKLVGVNLEPPEIRAVLARQQRTEPSDQPATHMPRESPGKADGRAQ